MRRKIAFLVFVIITSSLFAGFAYVNYQFNYRTPVKYFNSNGTDIHYTVEGDGVPVVLLHGFAVNGDINWRTPGVTAALAKHFKVVTIDHRGHGLSGKPHEAGKYGLNMAYDVVNLMDNLGIEKAHLVGYSMGGFIALKLAALYPDRWYSVVPMASGWENPENSRGFEVLNRVAAEIKTGKGIGPVISYYDKGEEPSVMQLYWVNLLTGYFNDHDALAALVIDAKELGVYPEQLSCITAPVCSIVGTDDPFLDSACNLVGKLEHHKLIVLKGEDHSTTPWMPRTKKALVNFLQAHNPS